MEHTLHQYTHTEQKNKNEETTIDALIFNSSLKKADGGMFEEPLASSSKEEKEAELGIDYGENSVMPE